MSNSVTVRFERNVPNDSNESTQGSVTIDSGQLIINQGLANIYLSLDNVRTISGDALAREIQTELNGRIDFLNSFREEETGLLEDLRTLWREGDSSGQYAQDIAMEIIRNRDPAIAITSERGSSGTGAITESSYERTPIEFNTITILSNAASPDGRASITYTNPTAGTILQVPISQMSQSEALVIEGMITSDVSLALAFESAVYGATQGSPFNHEGTGLPVNPLGVDRSIANYQEFSGTVERTAQALVDAADRDGIKANVGQSFIRPSILGFDR